MSEKIGLPEKKKEFKFEMIRLPSGDELICCPQRGGIITSLKFQGKEVLYLDENTLRDTTVNVKGGIPVLFPNAGPIPDESKNSELRNLEQHGFARKKEWQRITENNEIETVLKSDKETKEVYPYDFCLSLISKFQEDGSFMITQQVLNLGQEDMPISFGLHPYFKVPNELKKDIEFNFPGGDFVKENLEKWANGEAVKIDNPNTPMKVQIPGLGTLVFEISPEYKRIWVWSQPGKDFFCFEPVMGDKGTIITDPAMVKPFQQYSASMNIMLIN